MSSWTGKQAPAKLLKLPAARSVADGSPVLSCYAAGLSSEHLDRYLDKTSSIGHQDPYLLKMSPQTLPLTVTYESIIEYALNQQSAYTGSSFHCFKAVESKRKFEAGMVKLVEGKSFQEKYVVRGKVMHSMSFNNPCLTPWIIVEGSNVLSAHCDCIAGIGEVCSHVGAILYYLTNINHQQHISLPEEVAVTDREQQWGRPNRSITENLQQPIENIDYGYELTTYDDNMGNVPQLNFDQLQDVFRTLSIDESQCTVMQEFCCSEEGYCFRCSTLFIDHDYLQTGVMLDDLRDSTMDAYSIEQLHFNSLEFYSKMQSIMNEQLQLKIESETVAQTKSDLWKRLRTGRITASVVKSVCSTKIENPAISTIKKICYPDLTYFSTKATQHGKQNEKVAFKKLSKILVKSHKNGKLRESGLIIDLSYPELAASPDGLLECECCIKIPIEIKCPFKFKNENDILMKLARNDQPYIKVNSNTGYDIVKNHAYYGQVQMQIALTNAPYGYFYVWTKSEEVLIKVDRDRDYWQNMLTKSSNFFKVVILPELYAKFYTRKHEQKQRLTDLRNCRKPLKK